MKYITFTYLVLSLIVLIIGGPKDEKWKKKDVRDYTDADLERLYEQWEVNFFF